MSLSQIDLISKTTDCYIFLVLYIPFHDNAPPYNAVFNITTPCHGSQIDYFAIYK